MWRYQISMTGKEHLHATYWTRKIRHCPAVPERPPHPGTIREVYVSVRTIYRWGKLCCESDPKQEHTFTYHEYEALLRKVTKLENIITIIKTVRCTVRAPLRERLCELG